LSKVTTQKVPGRRKVLQKKTQRGLVILGGVLPFEGRKS